MSVDSIVTNLLDGTGTTSINLRAILLFEFQVAMFDKSFAKLLDGKPAGRVRRHARLFAAIKLLENIETQIRTSTGPSDSVPLKVLASNPSYCEIYDQVLAQNGGWAKIRYLPNAKSFDSMLRTSRMKAKAVARIVDFSYRFAALQSERGYHGKGGVTMARHVVGTAPSYEIGKSMGTMKNRWRAFGSGAAFIYLLEQQKYPLWPPRVSSKRFVPRLLRQAEDQEQLRKFFCAYQHVANVLYTRGYKFPKLTVDLNCPPPAIAAEPFSEDVEAAIANARIAYLD